MIDLDIVKILRTAADEYEALILRNRKLDSEINELKRKYNEDVNKIRSNPSPKLHTAKVVVDPAKLTPRNANQKYADYTPIASIPYVSKRAITALTKLKVYRVQDFRNLTLARVKTVKNCGSVTRLEIEDVARICGYTLK